MYRLACVVLACAAAAGPASAVDLLDPRDFDARVAACTDFYRFANGGWLDRTPVPPAAERINRFSELDARVHAQTLALLGELADGRADDPQTRPLADLVRSIRDEAALAAARTAALDALLGALPQATDGAQIAELVASLHARGLPLLFRIEPAGKGRLALRGDALTLADPAFHLDPRDEARDWLSRYRGYVETLLALAGSSDPSTESAWALDFDAKLALAAQQAGEQASRETSARKLAREFPQLPWKPLLKGLKLDRVDRFVIQDPASFAAYDRLLREAPAVQWRAWLRFRVAHLLAPWLDAPFRDAHNRFFRTALLGAPLPDDGDERALLMTGELLGDAFAQRYVDRHLDAARRNALETLAGALRQALATAIAGNERWQPGTRKAAQAKLDALAIEIVAPTAVDLSALQLNPTNLVGNMLAIQRWRVAGMAQRERRPAAANALRPQLGYLRAHNRVQLTPALLQAPLFDPAAEPGLQFAGLGSLIAHEMIHAVDLGGADFDARGAAAPWWDESDRAAWQQALQPLIAHYGRFPLAGGRPLDGERSLAENAADLGGLQLAWNAFAANHDPALPLRDGLTPGQRFFVGWASLWRENALEAVRLRDAERAEQAPPAVRATAPLAHVAAFAQTFGCSADTAMLSSAAPVRAWP